MKTILLKAVRDDEVITGLRLKSIYIAEDTKMNNGPCLVYGKADTWHEELKRRGYSVTEEEVDLDVQEASFNELSFTRYEDCYTSVYLFDDLAVKAGCDDGLDYFCKEGVTLDDAVERWGDDLPGEKDDILKLSIPKDAQGALAVKMEQLDYDVWDLLARAPCETLNGERIVGVEVFYKRLRSGATSLEALADTRDFVESYIQDTGDDDARVQELLVRIAALEQTPLPAQPQQDVFKGGTNDNP